MRSTTASTTVTAVALIALAALVDGVEAADATCTGKITWWNANNGDSPCKMFADLVRACVPDYQLPPLGVGYQYVAPYDDGCSCNTVAASLAAACVDCQHDLETHGAPWGEIYTNNTCSASQITIGALPNSVKYGNVATFQSLIPAWAFLDISGSYWIYSNAYAVATGSNGASSGTATATGTAPTTKSTSSTSNSTGTSSSKSVPIGPIVGGVCGGVAVLLSLYWLIAGCRKKRAIKEKKAAAVTPAKGWEVEGGGGRDMEQGHGGALVGVTPYQFSQSDARESTDQVGPLGARAMPFDQVSRSNTYMSSSTAPQSAYPRSSYDNNAPLSPDGTQGLLSQGGSVHGGYFPPLSAGGSSSNNSTGGPGGLRPMSHGGKSMRDAYDGQTYSASTPPITSSLGPNGSGGSTPSGSLPSPGGAHYSPVSIAPPSLHIDTGSNPTSPGIHHVQQAPIVPDRMIVEGREQDSGMTFEELGQPVPAAVSLPPSYEQASERPRTGGE